MANDDIFGDAEHRMSQAIEALRRELGSIRTGRAAPSLIEHISVEYYGTPTPLQQIAASKPDSLGSIALSLIPGALFITVYTQSKYHRNFLFIL